MGNPINITVRLQSTDLRWFVQISRLSHDKMVAGIYTIEQRGEIELTGKRKGEEKQMTDFVIPKEWK
jgi:hypothetical protein